MHVFTSRQKIDRQTCTILRLNISPFYVNVLHQFSAV